MKRPAVLLAVFATSACLAFVASAKESPRKPTDTAQRMLTRMDRNVDGKIDFEEYRNTMTRRFDARDTDKNGVLEGKEIPAEWLVTADVAATAGKVSQDVFAGELRAVFDRFDANHDGQLDAAEIASYAAARRAHEGSTP